MSFELDKIAYAIREAAFRTFDISRMGLDVGANVSYNRAWRRYEVELIIVDVAGGYQKLCHKEFTSSIYEDPLSEAHRYLARFLTDYASWQ